MKNWKYELWTTVIISNGFAERLSIDLKSLLCRNYSSQHVYFSSLIEHEISIFILFETISLFISFNLKLNILSNKLKNISLNKSTNYSHKLEIFLFLNGSSPKILVNLSIYKIIYLCSNKFWIMLSLYIQRFMLYNIQRNSKILLSV